MIPGLYLLLITSQLILPSASYADEFYEDSQQSSDNTLSKYWGIADTETVVGKLFQYKIPPEKDAFKGTILEYDVEGEEPNTLPKWLIYDRKRSILEGVATVDDIGDPRINVKAYDSKGKFVSDMFVIEVYPPENYNTNTKRKCRIGEEVMILAIIIDKDLNDLSPGERISTIRTLARVLNISPNVILLLPQFSTSDGSQNFVEPDSKFSGAGSNSSILTWQIGCNERIWAEQLDIVTLVKKYITSKSLAETLRLPISQWRLVSNSNPFRIRRNVPHDQTTLDEASGDNEEEEPDDANEDDEEINPSPSVPRPLLSAIVNDTIPSQQGQVEDDSTWLQSLNATKPEHTNPIPVNDEDDEQVTEQTELDRTNFNGQNDSVPIDGIFDLESSQSTTLIPCASCSSTDSNKRNETPTIRLPPRVIKTLGPFVIKTGKPYRERIPEDTFIDESTHSNTRNLSLKLMKQSKKCTENAWIELDPDTQTLLMLAYSNAISNYNITIEATNADNLSTNTSIPVSVQYRPEWRTINFEISYHLRLMSSDQHITTKLLLKLLDMIARLYGDSNTDNIMVRHLECDPFVFTWANTTLSSEFCDNSTIHKLLSVSTEEENSVTTSSRVRQYFDSFIQVEKVTWKGTGLCEDLKSPQPKMNFKPSTSYHIGNITARVGELLVYQIPDNAFYDPDVGSIRENKMAVTRLDQNTLLQDSWLQFDEKNQEIYGLPTNNDVGMTSYTVVCYDNQDTKNEEIAARQVIEVKVEPATRKTYNVEFRMTLNSSYEEFISVPMLRRVFIQKLSELFGDRNTSSIVVSGYESGSLIVIWHNKTLPVLTCPEDEIEKLRRVVLTDKGELSERVNKVLGPEFQALSVNLAPIGVCEGGSTKTHVTDIPRNSPDIGILGLASFEYYLREYLVEFIMPIVIIICMMTLAGIVACMLYKRQRRAKWNLNDETERRTYRNRGIPVIFKDELEERLETSNKSPIIMKEEKPPLPPPEYQKTLPVATTALLSDFDGASYHQESSSFSPRIVDRSERDKSSTPTYRKPPAYIPP